MCAMRYPSTARIPTGMLTPPPVTGVRLKLRETGETIERRLYKHLVIGRGHFYHPQDLQLYAEAAERAGVSRSHAMIVNEGSQIVIEDLDSVNGTYLNGSRLPAGTPASISDGDCLKLGQMEVEVTLLYNMPDED